MDEDYRSERREYASRTLEREQLLENPMQQFAGWLTEATEAGLVDATALTLATADVHGLPAARIVLLKSFDEYGYVFYTDYQSQKGQMLTANPQAEMLFYWREFERQVRITGPVQQVSAEESDAYFVSRPRESQISATISAQSQSVQNRQELEQRAEKLARQAQIKRPETWGGYRLQANRYEFWQGRSGRLHDRFQFTQTALPADPAKGWDIVRLQP